MRRMLQPGEAIVRQAIESLAAGEAAELCGTLLARDIRWREPGRSLVAGEYLGFDEVAGSLFARLRELSDGSYRVADWEAFSMDPRREVAMYLVRARRAGRDLLSRDVCIADVRAGTIVAAQVFHADQHDWDRFWS